MVVLSPVRTIITLFRLTVFILRACKITEPTCGRLSYYSDKLVLGTLNTPHKATFTTGIRIGYFLSLTYIAAMDHRFVFFGKLVHLTSAPTVLKRCRHSE